MKRHKRLKFGSIDLLAWNDSQVVVFEVKHVPDFGRCLHDITQGLGQLLSYRDQFKLKKGDNRPVRYVLYSNGELEFDKEYQFLKALYAKYDVILHMFTVEHVRYL